MHDDVWTFDGEDIVIRIFIRSDDPIRKSMGEILGTDLEEIGFLVQRDYGDLNKAFVTVYGSGILQILNCIYRRMGSILCACKI